MDQCNVMHGLALFFFLHKKHRQKSVRMQHNKQFLFSIFVVSTSNTANQKNVIRMWLITDGMTLVLFIGMLKLYVHC